MLKVLRSLFGAGEKPKKDHSEFVAGLEARGFFRYLDAEGVPALKKEFDRIGWAAVVGQSGRMFHADAENLAEEGVVGFLEEVTPFLEGQGVPAFSATDEVTDTDYWVTVDGRRHVIFTSEEYGREHQEPGLL